MGKMMSVAFVAVAALCEAQVGSISFPTSASPEAQQHFLRGVAILHSFGFDDAADAFREAQKIDPDFALAYWGEAMAANDNPLASPTRQDLSKARAALRKLAPTRAERIAKAKTEREKLWMEAVEALYGPGDKESRDQAYADAMATLVERYPEDQEARAFYALALLGTVRRAGEDFDRQMKAAAIAQQIYRENPNHPGAAHYIIHAFDDPTHAPLALYAADRYAEIAPDVEHALHMPSHIFVQLGQWEKVAKSNKRAYEASVKWAEERGLSDTRRDFHALSWMEYGYLQRGELEKAKACIEEIRPIAEREVTTSRIKATFANMTARFLIETTDWDAMEVPVEPLLGERHAGDVYLLLAAGMKALAKNDLPTAEKIEARLAELKSQDTDGLKSYLQGQVTLEDLKISAAVAHLEIAALIRLAKGDDAEAIRLMEEAIEKEKEMHPAYGPPEPMVPPRELYAEVLMKSGRVADAATEYETMLSRMPHRTESLLGAARAADALGDHETARKRYRQLADIWADSDPTPRLREVEQHVNETSP